MTRSGRGRVVVDFPCLPPMSAVLRSADLELLDQHSPSSPGQAAPPSLAPVQPAITVTLSVSQGYLTSDQRNKSLPTENRLELLDSSLSLLTASVKTFDQQQK